MAPVRVKSPVQIHSELAFEDGSFIYVDYTEKDKEDNRVYETTLEDVAKSAGLHREGDTYEPRLIILGQTAIPKGFEEALKGAEVGKQMTVEVPPEKAYGEKDPRKTKHYSARAFERNEVPRPGSHVEVDGQIGTVLSVGGGRVLVDFNDPRAGRTLIYDFTVRSVVEKQEDKVRALAHRRLPSIKSDDVVVILDGNACTIQLPEKANLLNDVQYQKAALAREINKNFPGITTVHFVDTFLFKPPEQPKEGEASEKPASEQAVEKTDKEKGASEKTSDKL